MAPALFARAVDEIPFDNVIVFELTSGARVIAFDRVRLRVDADGLCGYTEDDGEVSFFDASSVARILTTDHPPLSDRLRPSKNGKH